DGGLTGGVALEGLNQGGYLKRKLIVILNDNEMSIAPNVGAMSGYLLRIARGQFYNKVRGEVAHVLKKLPKGEKLAEMAEHLEDGLKKALVPGTLFEELGFKYVGPIDGHNLPALIRTLREAKDFDGPILVHARTTKGKGYALAEKDPVFWHGPSPFKVETGEVAKKAAPPSYTAVFADTLAELAARDERIVAITAAMPDGTGLDRFEKKFPGRTFDVGICEQHAVLFAAGMATQGMKPVCAIYSTFLQRAYDQVFHDVCLMDLPVVFALDRGGVVGADGPTHHGAYDLSYLRVFPNMMVAAPKDENELRSLVATALTTGHPTAVRYPRGAGHGVALDPEPRLLPVGKGEVLRVGKDVFAIGDPVLPALAAAERLAAEGGASLTVVNARWVKPLDTELVAQFVKPGTRVFTVEENAVAGGFGSAVSEALDALGIVASVHRIGIPDRFVPHATQAEQRADLGIDEEGLFRTFREKTAGADVVPIRTRVAS
ncbi:MAG: 1-deoxy-D-xylulose-5-phosphate synthase, partial [Thermoanaerobaculia bacterium]|nr:1-deoxy-D-xylulose-5-phosphate synthase [Thermoanaerobaculia bacterium]